MRFRNLAGRCSSSPTERKGVGFDQHPVSRKIGAVAQNSRGLSVDVSRLQVEPRKHRGAVSTQTRKRPEFHISRVPRSGTTGWSRPGRHLEASDRQGTGTKSRPGPFLSGSQTD